EEREKEEQEKLEQQRKEAEKIAKKAFGAFSAFSLIPIVMFIIVAAIIATSFFRFHNNNKTPDSDFESGFEEKEEVQQNVTVGYKEKAETKDYDITLTEYEFFEYKSDKFPDSYNTKAGYQKIAFLVKIDNKTDKALNTSFEFDYSMKADSYKVEEAEYEKGMFTYPSPGKDKYPSIKFTEVEANDSLQGYVNFTVPTNAKELKLKIGDYVTIKMDNPAYKG
ncbi:MAG: hypothetical protein IJ193_01530, partial [Bacilli bacterium]|nr:hypothetical protein [Bacilli bacterium]